MVDPSDWRIRRRADDDDLAEERFERGHVVGKPVLEAALVTKVFYSSIEY
tara:strand:- start:714 stop:863 length:150 start_codon:yes stop_codon:yes gene_type:complete